MKIAKEPTAGRWGSEHARDRLAEILSIDEATFGGASVALELPTPEPEFVDIVFVPLFRTNARQDFDRFTVLLVDPIRQLLRVGGQIREEILDFLIEARFPRIRARFGLNELPDCIEDARAKLATEASE